MEDDHTGTQKATFRFYAELNDFLPPERRKKPFEQSFFGQPSVKDCIEAIGPPHPEIDLILANGVSVDFKYRLKDGDTISVYPMFERFDISSVIRLRPVPLRDSCFILDIQLGKLARHLRMLGFDTLFRNDLKVDEFIDKACREERILLTRDTKILKHGRVQRGIWIRSPDPNSQISQIVRQLDLYSRIRPFSRCLECNGPVEIVAKKDIENRLEYRTRIHYDTFKRCTSCGKIYWRGSHTHQMLNFIERIVNENDLNHEHSAETNNI